MRHLLVLALLLALPAAAGAKKKKGSDGDEEKAKPKKIKVTPNGPCEKKGLAELAAELKKTPPAQRPDVASKGIFEACNESMPADFADALNSLHHTALEDRGPMVLKALAQVPDLANAACAKFEEGYGAHLAPGDKLPHVYKTCEFSKLNVVSEKEFAAIPDLGTAYIIVPLYKWLADNGMDPKVAKKLVREMTILDTLKLK
jgi:hypothetical protein